MGVSSGDDDGSDSDEATSEEADEDADDEADESSRETSSMMWFSIDASAKPSAIVWGPGDRPVGEPAVGRFRCRLALPRRCAERRPRGRLCHVEVGVKGNARGCGLERTTLRHKQGLGRGGGWKRDGRRWGGL